MTATDQCGKGTGSWARCILCSSWFSSRQTVEILASVPARHHHQFHACYSSRCCRSRLCNTRPWPTAAGPSKTTPNKHRTLLLFMLRADMKGKGKVRLTSICIAHRHENLTSNALRCVSHSVTCQQHHTCIYP